MGLSGLKFHELRHTFVALWIAAGANPKEVSVRAGHSSVAFTLDRYGHLYEDLRDEIPDRLDTLSVSDTCCPFMSRSGTRATYWLRYLGDTLRRGLGGVDATWSASQIGERAVLAGAVVTDRMRPDELVADRDLHALTDHRHLHLATPELGPGAVAGAGEADVAAAVDLAGHRDRGGSGAPGLRRSHAAPQSGGLPIDPMSAGVGGDEHPSVMKVHESVLTDHADVLAGQPHPAR